MPKNPHAVALGRRGGRADTPAQAVARARNARNGGRKRLYRVVKSVLQKRQGDRWLDLEPPLDAAAHAFLRRNRNRRTP